MNDGFQSEDQMALHLVNLINSRIGAEFMQYISPRFEDYDGERVMVVDCQGSRAAVFVRDGDAERFYIRTGPSTTELSAKQVQAYIKQRFR